MIFMTVSAQIMQYRIISYVGNSLMKLLHTDIHLLLLLLLLYIGSQSYSFGNTINTLLIHHIDYQYI